MSQDDKKFWKIKVMVSFHLFEYNNSDVIELFAYGKSTGKDFNRMCFSKSAILGIGTLRDSIGKIFEERLAAMSIVRGKSAGSNFEVGDELILRDIQDRMLGEYILAHISLEEVQSSARNKSASYEIQFCPPDEHDPAKLVIFRPPELGDIEPYRDIEMQRYLYGRINLLPKYV